MTHFPNPAAPPPRRNVTEKVLARLEGIFPQASCAEHIVQTTGENFNSVKGALLRLVAQGRAERQSKGWYKAKKARAA